MDMKQDVIESSDFLSQRGEAIKIVTTKAERIKEESSTYFREVVIS